MSRLSIFLQIIKETIFKPRLAIELAAERAEIKEDEQYKKIQYSYDFSSIEEFFSEKFPSEDISRFETELIELEEYSNEFLKDLDLKNYPSKEKPYPINYSISSDSRKFLYILCRIMKPKNVIETGIAYGLSSFYILSALKKNDVGRLYSIDSIFRPWQSEKMIGIAVPENLRDRWKVVLGKSNERLEKVFNETNNVGIFIHDSLHSYKNMIFEFNCAIDRIQDNGIIISDDVLGNDAFHDFTNKNNLKNSILKIEDSVIGYIEKN